MVQHEHNVYMFVTVAEEFMDCFGFGNVFRAIRSKKVNRCYVKDTVGSVFSEDVQ